jgi:hypothetical protein
VAQAHGHERNREWQTGQQVPWREPEAEHRGRHEPRHQQLGAERGGAECGRQLDRADPRHRLPQPLAMRVPQPPEARKGQREDRRPAEQAVVAIEEQGDEPVATVEVAARRVRVGRALARSACGVRRGAAVERLVEGHIERHREERELDHPHRERPPPSAPERSNRDGADHHTRRRELRAQPRQGAEQREAEERLRANDPLPKAQGEQRRAGERRAGGEFWINGAAVGHERGAEPDGESGAERPRVGRHAQREPVRQRQRECRDRGEKELDSLRPTKRVRRGDQEGKADPVRLVEPALGPAPLPAELVGVEPGVRAVGVLVEHVHVAVLDDRGCGEQVVRLVAGIVGPAEGIQSEGGCVDGEQQQPEGEGATHRRRTLAVSAYATTAISSW